MSEAWTEAAAARVKTAELRRIASMDVLVLPDSAWLAEMAGENDLLGLRKVRLTGQLSAVDGGDVKFTGHLGATIVQPCVVTLAPVTTRIETDVARRFLSDWQEPEGDEVEMPEDDSQEPLGSIIDLSAILAEALALTLPLYPKAEGADLGEAVFAADGVTPLRDADLKPFASLAAFKNKLSDGADGDKE